LLVSAYDQFVQDSDQSIGRPDEERRDIAIYGLAGEVGSVVAAIKKKLLSEGGEEAWNVPNKEIIEELGDVVWYCFSLARIANSKKPVNIFAHDIANLKAEIGADDARARRIKGVLDSSKREEFLKAAENFPRRTKALEFEDYQTIAFLTARTKDKTLVEVCLAVLWQLSAQLFRRKLPAIEQELNQALENRPINDILGEIAWHVSALASIYNVKLSDIAAQNMAKVTYRLDRSHLTPLHDEGLEPDEQFPRRFDISFVTVAPGRSRMYFQGRRLGDELTDNNYEDDGYRYHDVMHLANAAKLGWSPVLRSLLRRKRKSQKRVDEVEDGARARIVEEVVINAIHSEGERLAQLAGNAPGDVVRLFPSGTDVTFRFLKLIQGFVGRLEVKNNKAWEWEEAIVEGCDVFHKLRIEGQGTVTVDLDSRSLTFRPEVWLGLRGQIAGLGSARVEAEHRKRPSALRDTIVKLFKRPAPARAAPLTNRAQKLAILDSLGIAKPAQQEMELLSVTDLDVGEISVKAAGNVQMLIWKLGIVAFRTTLVVDEQGDITCTAVAVADEEVTTGTKAA
jgi:NTP pyrophosphatase (non-canonical NTP hydrolase)